MAGRRTKTQQRRRPGPDSREAEAEEIDRLESRITTESPPRGMNPLLNDSSSYSVSYPSATRFRDLPLSNPTLRSLDHLHFTDLTPIQRATIPHALAGRDILGAANTGSGKTLAFVVPLLELLYRRSWTPMDGLGALVISPTRELSAQIFDVLRGVGKFHNFSAGAVLGGKSADDEAESIGRMCVVVATPGRLLYHLDNTAGFSCESLQMLVLDEADRILDLGFSRDLNAILEHLPKTRQTLLFSATQTRSLKDLARLSLRDPEFISVDEKSETATPEALAQRCVVVPLGEKLDTLAAFVRTHSKSKIMVFFATCKQVRFAYEAFTKVRPQVAPISFLHLHGRMSQERRMEIYAEFSERRSAMVLFATDIAARGLDFPFVNWIVQFDCPDDVETYIHRVGRTARYKSKGQSLLLLTPTERAFVELLNKARVPISEMAVNPKKLFTVQSSVEAVVTANPDVRHLAQKAFVSYVRSIYLQKNKAVFDVRKLPLEELAKSFGLPSAPQINFTRKGGAVDAPQEEDEEAVDSMRLARKALKNAPRSNQTKKPKVPEAQKNGGDEEEEGDELLKARVEGQAHLEIPEATVFGKEGELRLYRKNPGQVFQGKRKVFGEEGDEGDAEKEGEEKEEEGGRKESREMSKSEWEEKVRRELENADEEDKANQKELLKKRNQKKRQLLKHQRVVSSSRGEDGEGFGGAVLVPPEEEDEDDDEEEEEAPPSKRSRTQTEGADEGLEAMALKLLEQSQ